MLDYIKNNRDEYIIIEVNKLNKNIVLNLKSLHLWWKDKYLKIIILIIVN